MVDICREKDASCKGPHKFLIFSGGEAGEMSICYITKIPRRESQLALSTVNIHVNIYVLLSIVHRCQK